jgi:predicted CoA-binding protein
MKNQTVLVLGATDNTNLTSYSAIKLMMHRGLHVMALGPKKTRIDQIAITDEPAAIKQADVVSIFLSAKKQRKYYDYILSLKPEKLVFNPGTENPELEFLAQKNQIQIIKGCTIALLANGLW